MKFEVNRQAMLEAAKSVSKVVPSFATSEILKQMLLESNEDTGEVYMTATNYEVSIQQKVIASVEESGALLIDPRLLVGMMSKLEGDFVSLSTEPNNPTLLKVTNGRCIFRIFCTDSRGYPKPTMPFPDESVIMTGICSLAKRTTFLVSKNDSRPALQCVQVKLKNNAVHAAASDGIGRMMLVKDSAEHSDEHEFLLPGRSLQVLASISSDDDVFEVDDIGREVVFVRGDMIFTIRKLMVGDFVDTAALLKKIEPIYVAIVDVAKMKEILSLISVVALSGVTIKPINLVMSNNEIILQCDDDLNAVTSVVATKISQNTPDTGFYYDISALMKLFNVVSGKVKLEIDAKGIILIKTRSEAYFQAPVRAPEKKEPAPKQDKDKERTKGARNVKETKETKGVA